MAALSAYNALPVAGATYATTSQIPEILLKTYTITPGVTSVTVSDALFSLTKYKAIRVRVNNLTTSGTSSTYLTGGPMKNGSNVNGTYYYTYDSISSSTQTGFGGSSVSVSSTFGLTNIQLTQSPRSFLPIIPEINFVLNSAGMSVKFDNYDLTNAQRMQSTVTFPSVPQTFTTSDYIGMIFAFGSGTFTGGTISVYGVQ